ncbi:MAG: Ig-like domain-containing protein, partial [Pseudomonadales bacterium]
MSNVNKNATISAIISELAVDQWLSAEERIDEQTQAELLSFTVRVPRSAVADEIVTIEIEENGRTFSEDHRLTKEDIELGGFEIAIDKTAYSGFSDAAKVTLNHQTSQESTVLTSTGLGEVKTQASAATPQASTQQVQADAPIVDDEPQQISQSTPVVSAAPAAAPTMIKLFGDDNLVNEEEADRLHAEVIVPQGTLVGDIILIYVATPSRFPSLLTHTLDEDDMKEDSLYVSVPLPKTIDGKFLDGDYEVNYAIASPLGGTHFHGTVSFVLDATTSESQVEILSMSDDTGVAGDFVTSDQSLTLFGSISKELASDERLEVSVDGGVTWLAAGVNGLHWVFSDGLTHDSDFVYKVRVIDTAGNIASEDEQQVNIDLLKPTASTTTISLDENITDDDVINKAELGSDIAITGTVEGEYTSGDRVTIEVDGIEYSGNVAANGTFVVEVPASALAADTDRTIRATVEATDLAGNKAEKWAILDTESYSVNLSANQVGVPSDTDGALNQVKDNASEGTYVNIDVNAVDIDEGDTVTYKLLDSANGAFRIDKDTGKVFVADSSKLNATISDVVTITVLASSSDGSSKPANFQILVQAGSTGPGNNPVGPVIDSDIDDSNVVAFNAGNGAYVGITASAIDPDNETVTYRLTDSANGAFAIDRSTGRVTVADATKLGSEGDTYKVSVVAESTDDTNSTEDFTITLGSAAPGGGGGNTDNEVGAVVDTDDAENTIGDAANNGTYVNIDINAKDDDGDKVTYELINDANGAFAIDPDTGRVTVADNTKLDSGVSDTASIKVRATSADGSTNEADFDITITAGGGTNPGNNPVGPVTDSDTDDSNVVAFNAGNGAYVGITASATDPDGETVTYRL